MSAPTVETHKERNYRRQREAQRVRTLISDNAGDRVRLVREERWDIAFAIAKQIPFEACTQHHGFKTVLYQTAQGWRTEIWEITRIGKRGGIYGWRWYKTGGYHGAERSLADILAIPS